MRFIRRYGSWHASNIETVVTQTYACARVHTHMHTHAHAHTHTHTRARARVHTHTRTHLRTHTRTRAHTHTYIRTHARTRAHAGTHTLAVGRNRLTFLVWNVSNSDYRGKVCKVRTKQYKIVWAQPVCSSIHSDDYVVLYNIWPSNDIIKLMQ